ncbi:MAG TPA: hypothetical protein VGK67_32075 [Myxococcales bacterium]|jgi:hypothetical protein
MRVLTGVLVLVLVAAAGCSAFCPGPKDCISNGAVVVYVVDADTKDPLPDATVLASLGGANPPGVPACRYDFEHAGADAGPTHCRAIVAPGSYHLTIRAAGYVEAELDVDSPRDACGDVTSQVREVGLHKLGSSAQPLIDSSEKCGG